MRVTSCAMLQTNITWRGSVPNCASTRVPVITDAKVGVITQLSAPNAKFLCSRHSPVVMNSLWNVEAILMKPSVSLNARRYLNVDTDVRTHVVLHVPKNVKFPARKFCHVDTKKVCFVTGIPIFFSVTASVLNFWNVVTPAHRNVKKLVNATPKLKKNYPASTE